MRVMRRRTLPPITGARALMAAKEDLNLSPRGALRAPLTPCHSVPPTVPFARQSSRRIGSRRTIANAPPFVRQCLRHSSRHARTVKVRADRASNWTDVVEDHDWTRIPRLITVNLSIILPVSAARKASQTSALDIARAREARDSLV